MARTADPHAATVKAWKTRARSAGGSGVTQGREDWHVQKEPGGRAMAGRPTVGLNAEDYKGGQFLPSGDLPKWERRRRERILERTAGEKQITGPNSPGGVTRAKPPLPGLKPFLDLFPGDPDHPLTRRQAAGTAPYGEDSADLRMLLSKWDAGARWFNVADWLADRVPYYDMDGRPV